MIGLTISVPGARVVFRDIIEEDAYIVALWRNLPEARESFFDKSVVTPDTHRQFVRNRKSHDLVWMACLQDGKPVGMVSLTVNVMGCRGEYGRLFISPDHRGEGYAKEIEYLLLYLAFEFFRLDLVWLDAYKSNEAIINLHNKTGWELDAVDMPGHTDEHGSVVHMIYTREMWRDTGRDRFQKDFPKVELTKWVE